MRHRRGGEGNADAGTEEAYESMSRLFGMMQGSAGG